MLSIMTNAYVQSWNSDNMEWQRIYITKTTWPNKIYIYLKASSLSSLLKLLILSTSKLVVSRALVSPGYKKVKKEALTITNMRVFLSFYLWLLSFSHGIKTFVYLCIFWGGISILDHVTQGDCFKFFDICEKSLWRFLIFIDFKYLKIFIRILKWSPRSLVCSPQ